MAKQLKDFTMRVNCKGWYLRGVGTFERGQEIKGEQIVPRMVQALEDGDDFKMAGNRNNRAPVAVLHGGTVAELKEAMATPAPSAVPAPAPKVEQDPPKPAPAPKVEQDPPKRKPKPKPSTGDK